MSMLDFLGHRYGTDKASGGHGYLEFYELHLAHLRDCEMTLLEIGIGDGASLKMWRDYFQRGRIIGMDNDRGKLRFVEPHGRIEIVIGDQADVEHLDRVARDFGRFDVIVDDAGHQCDEQILSYRTLLPALNPGGLYILEDIGGSPTIEMLSDMSHKVMNGHEKIEMMAFFMGTSITKMKRDA